MGWFDENHWAGEEAMSRMCGDYYDHRDIDGKYFAGTRKCSQCKKLKTKKDFNKEQEKKTAAKRICNECGPPLPKDVSILTKAEIMTELQKRGVDELPPSNAKKAEVLACLQNILEAEAPPPGANDQENQKPLPKYWSQWKVVELKEELKRRGLKVSGTKGVLTTRLSENTGIPAESPSKSKLNMSASANVPGSAPVVPPLADVTNESETKVTAAQAPVLCKVRQEDMTTRRWIPLARRCEGKGCKNGPKRECPFGCCGKCCPGHGCKVKSHRHNSGKKKKTKKASVDPITTTISTVSQTTSTNQKPSPSKSKLNVFASVPGSAPVVPPLVNITTSSKEPVVKTSVAPDEKASEDSINKTISTVSKSEPTKEVPVVDEPIKNPIATEPSTNSSATITVDNLSAPKVEVTCNGKGTCAKMPSSKCSYGCCGKCCRADFGMGCCNAKSHRSTYLAAASRPPVPKVVKKPVPTAKKKRERLMKLTVLPT